MCQLTNQLQFCRVSKKTFSKIIEIMQLFWIFAVAMFCFVALANAQSEGTTTSKLDRLADRIKEKIERIQKILNGQNPDA